MINKVKTISIFIICVIISLMFSYYPHSEYSRHKRAVKCVITNNEDFVFACLEDSYAFFTRNNPIKSSQDWYDFHYAHRNMTFQNIRTQNLFLNSYESALNQCKNIIGCSINDDGKGYYIALNKCLLNGNCIDHKGSSDDCFESYEIEIKHIPVQYKNLITATKEQACINKQ